MKQEVQVNITLTVSADVKLSKTQIIKQVRDTLKNGIQYDHIETTKVKVNSVKEEAEIYGNE